MADPASMPYRSCVAVMLFNDYGSVWLGRRLPKWELAEVTAPWQCPQGGIDPGETPEEAARRELYEEVGCDNATFITESRTWHLYDLPPEALGIALKGKYRGQRQKWFLMQFAGDETEFNLIPPPPNKQEFDAWRWVPIDDVPKLVVDFKRHVYHAVIEEFRPVMERQLGRSLTSASG